MTQEEICEFLVSKGFVEYKYGLRENSRCFYGYRFEDSMECRCNDRPPSLHVYAHEDIVIQDMRHEGTVEFNVVGEGAGELWVNITIYSVRREEVEEKLPTIRIASRAMWEAFYEKSLIAECK